MTVGSRLRTGVRTTMLTTPEGVPLSLEIAGLGERAAALAIDIVIGHGALILLIVTIAFLVISSPVSFLSSSAPDGLFAIILLLMFLVRTPYFTFFELLWQGQTPGKRALKLHVVDRHGGELAAGAVVARNLMREVEVFLPISLLLSVSGNPDASAQSWIYLVWVSVLLAVPFFNRQRLRAGDLIGGTVVIHRPRPILEEDLAERTHGFRFSDRHLEAYGAYELQVLEEILRRPDRRDHARIRDDVAARIARKIGYEEHIDPDRIDEFLAAFYAAQRAHLERHQLFGERRANKYYADKDNQGE